MTLQPPPNEFYRGRGTPVSFEEHAAAQEIERRCASIKCTPDIAAMLQWRPKDPNQYQHPSYDWFKAHSQTKLRSIAEVYPAGVDVGDALDDLKQRWNENESLARERHAKEEQTRKRNEEQIAFASLPPEERAFELWKALEIGQQLQWIYEPNDVRKRVPDLNDHVALQRWQLTFLRDKHADKCKEWKKKYTKDSKKDTWKRLCDIAHAVGADDFTQ